MRARMHALAKGGAHGSEVWTGSGEGSEERDAQIQERQAQKWPGRQGQEPQTGDRHRTQRGTEEGRESAAETLLDLAVSAKGVGGLLDGAPELRIVAREDAAAGHPGERLQALDGVHGLRRIPDDSGRPFIVDVLLPVAG